MKNVKKIPYTPHKTAILGESGANGRFMVYIAGVRIGGSIDFSLG